MVKLRSGRSGRLSNPAAAKTAPSPRQAEPRVRAQSADAIVVRCLHCRHQAVLSGADLAAHGVTPDSPIAGFVRRLKCSECGSGSVLAKRVMKPQPKAAHRRIA
jgi:hypothetical protein